MLHRCSPDARLAMWRTAGWLVTAAGGALLLVAGIQWRSWRLAVPGGAALAVGAIGLYLVRTMAYDISAFELVVRLGPFRRRIPLECIEGVLPAHFRTVGLGQTLDYLAIVYRKNGRPRVAHLYPEDPAGFVDALVTRAPFLERRGDRVVRMPSLGGVR